MAEDSPHEKPHAFSPLAVPASTSAFYQQIAVTPILPQSRLVTLAGQTGTDPVSGNIPKDFLEQVRIAYARVLDCLKAVNATPRDIIFVRHYLVRDDGKYSAEGRDIEDRDWGDLWREFMQREGGGHCPPDTLLGVASLAKAELLYEVEVWAIVHGG